MSWQKVLRIVSSGMITIILISTLILVLFYTLGQLWQKGMTEESMFRVMVVLSGSMSPVFNTGDGIILVRNQAKSPYRIGEIITYRDPLNGQRSITHRVIDIVEGGNQISYRTKGDANKYPDPGQVSAKDVIGQEFWRLPYLGKVIGFVQNPIGASLLIIVPGLVVIAGEFGSNLKTKPSNTQHRRRSVYSKASKTI